MNAVATTVDTMVSQSPIQSQGRIETAKILHSNVVGSGRTQFGLECGRIANDHLLETCKTVKQKKDGLRQFAQAITGNIDDSEPKGVVRDYLILHHVAMRSPLIKEVGWTFARDIRSAAKITFDFASMTDSLTADQQAKLNEVLPLLLEHELGTDDKGKPSRKEWKKAIRLHVLGIKEEESKEEETASEEDSQEQASNGLTSSAAVLQWLQGSDKAVIAEMVKQGGEELILKLFDACELAAPSK